MDTGDKTYIKGEDATPQIMACIMHPTKRAHEMYETGPTSAFAGARYGLCLKCMNRQMNRTGYKELIYSEIETRLKTLKERGDLK